MATGYRSFLAETAGTATLCGFGFGSAVVAGVLSGDSPTAALLLIAVAWGLGLALAIYGFAATSGAHLNPTVTLVLAIRGRFPWRQVPAYLTAQVLGATAAAALVRAVYGELAVSTGLGASRVGEGFEVWQGFAAEAVAGFALVLSIYALVFGGSAPSHVVGLGVGLTLSGVILTLGPVAGASINAARTLGPELVLRWSGEDVPWGDLWLYLAGPLVGGLLAAVLFENLGPRTTTVNDERTLEVRSS